MLVHVALNLPFFLFLQFLISVILTLKEITVLGKID